MDEDERKVKKKQASLEILFISFMSLFHTHQRKGLV